MRESFRRPYQSEDLQLRGLVQSAVSGTLALPEFQRDFVWRAPAVRTLLASVAMGWPISSFMIWDPGEFEMEVKPFKGVPAAARSEQPMILLDGQQRLTGLIHALHPDYSENRYYLEDLVEFLTSEGEPDVENLIAYSTVKQFQRKYGSLEERAKHDVALVADVLDDELFREWTDLYERHHPQEARPKWFDLRAERLPGFKSYEIPCVRLEPSLDLEAVAVIFETTNRTGVKLGTVDLMTAKLYRHRFRLRDKWQSVVDEHIDLLRPFVQPASDTVDAEDVLRILTYWETGGRGVTRGNILKAKPADLIAHWDRAVAALMDSIRLLRDRCGVVQGSLLPASMMLVPVAVALDAAGYRNADEDERHEIAKHVERWFWTAVAEATFTRSTNTRAIREAKQLAETIQADGPPISPGRPKRELIADLRDRLLDPSRGERSLEAAAMSLIVIRGGKDWRHGQHELAGQAGELEAHHVVPRAAKAAKGWPSVNCIANLTPQSAASNKELKNYLPLDAGVTSDTAAAHFCKVAELGGTTAKVFQGFAEERAAALAEAIYKRATGRR